MNWYASLLAHDPAQDWTMAIQNRLLIVEDDLELRDAMLGSLNGLFSQNRIDLASSADEVTQNVNSGDVNLSELYSLVVADIVLPGRTSGIDLWNWCKSEFPGIRFLFMSGMGEKQYRATMCRYADSIPPFLPKPFSSTQCREAIRSVMRGGLAA